MNREVPDEYPYYDEKYFNEYDSDEYLPPWIEREDWVDPNWNWFDRSVKRLLPHMWKLFIGTCFLFYGYLWPFLYDWYYRQKFDFSENEADEDDEG